jgi:dipeptidase D
MSFVETLEPTTLWQHFDQILTIPRGSKNEAKIRQLVIDIAKRNGAEYQVDGAGNVVIRKPAAPGHESAPITILQAHLDMVNEKNSDVAHDFEKDPISPQQDGDYLTATGTTLGSDNGVGVAAELAVLESDDIAHGPLELLFTVDEETGLTGAASLDGGMLQGRRLLNLDSEEEGIVYIGCAGGGDTNLTLPLRSVATPSDTVALNIRLHGLKGGHSGCDIHLQRGNAIKLLVRSLYAISLESKFHLASLKGGGVHNAIPRETFATVAVAAGAKGGFTKALKAEYAAVQLEFGPAEPDMKLEVSDADAPKYVWDTVTADTVMRLITGLPHGVVAMSYDIPDLVETSTNLATVTPKHGSLVIGLSSRSSIDSALAALRQSIRATGVLAGASVEEGNAYPGWKPDLQSPLLAAVKEVHKRELGHPRRPRVWHHRGEGQRHGHDLVRPANRVPPLAG